MAAARATHIRSGLRQRGFTLVEVLVAFTVLALIAIPASSILRDAARGAGASERYARAVSVARSRIDALRAARSSGADGGLETAGRIEDESGDFDWEFTFEPYADALLGEESRGRPALEMVAITVSWEGRGRPQQIRLETLLLEPTQ